MAAKKKPVRKSASVAEASPADPDDKRNTGERRESLMPIQDADRKAAKASSIIREAKRIDANLFLQTMSELMLAPRILRNISAPEHYSAALKDVAIALAEKLQNGKELSEKQVREDQRVVRSSFDMVAVDSSNVASIGYDKTTKTMRVLFKNGSSYRYTQVEPELHARIMESDSVGKTIREVYSHPTVRE